MSSPAGTVTQPSSILFFIAIAVGVLIAFVFVFFSLRYYVRTKLGIYATARLTTTGPRGGGNLIVLNSDFPIQQLNVYNHDLQNHMRLQRQRRKYMKKRRLTEEEVDHLFPIRTYQNWLDGGAERDIETRDIMTELKQEHDEIINEQILDENTEPVANNEEVEQRPAEVDLGNPFIQEIHYDSGTCAICIDTFEPEDMVRGLICGHVFHQECLDPWLTKRKACCPMCKRDYYMKTNDEEEDANDADSVVNWPEIQYTTLDDRVAEIVQRHPEIENIAREKVKEYMSLKWRIFWCIMGISKTDLINCTIVSEDGRRRETGSYDEQQPSDTYATEAEPEPTAQAENQEEIDLASPHHSTRPSQETRRETVERMA